MFIADLHIHSKYSRATSGECVPEILEMWARRKGINVVGTGDFTHPAWREELKEKLIPSGDGLYELKSDLRKEDRVEGGDFKPQFIVSGEISSIYKKNGRVRKVHSVILLPGIEHAEAISRRLEAIGNLHSDGRPILGLDSRDLLEIVLETCPEGIFIPAHIWTPHFSLFGAYSGFDDINECFEDLTDHICALETGLSSDPPMNRRLSALDKYALVSNSDAHSPANLGREANIFDTEVSYGAIARALKNPGAGGLYGTIEFFPEEGKYHYDGHRACKVCWKPSDTKAAGGICPECGGRITVGVLHRVEELADREEGFVPPGAKPFESLVPLKELIASSIGYTTASGKVRGKYEDLLRLLGPELFILREAPLEDVELAAGPCIAEGIRRLRSGRIEIQPGFDGEYGKIKVMDKSEIDMLSGQLSLIDARFDPVKRKTKPAARHKKAQDDGAAPSPAPVSGCPAGGGEITEAAAPEGPYGLNREQWEAVSASDPAIAVIAGPGTGKTKTLVSRIAYLVEKCGVHPSRITAVTFTNKAAREMRTRLERHFGNRRTAKAITIGTFHSICLQLLSEWRGRESITVIDEYNAASIVEEILKSIQLKASPRETMRGISLMKNGVPPKGYGREPEVPEEVYRLYCSQLERYGVMDFDDLLLEVLRRFELINAGDIPGDDRESSFEHLLVDEFQDINELQYKLIREWSGKSRSIFIIGDPDQSIYGFRGSDFRYFERFKEDFPGLRDIRLTSNYRSTPEIILCAASVISKEDGGRSRSLEAKRENGARVRLLEAEDEFSEALFVAKEINRLVGGIDMLDTHTMSARGRKKPAAVQPRGFSDIAVLYRTNRQAEILEHCLRKEGIQYVVAGRDEFLKAEPVRQAVAFFRFLINPRDIVSLRVCLKTGGVYPEEVLPKVLEGYAASAKTLEALAGIAEKVAPPRRAGDRPGSFLELLRKYEPAVNREKPSRLIESWIDDNALSDEKCMEQLLYTSVLHNEMPSFIQNLVLGRESDVVRSGARVYSPEAVSLMTMHGAKGLEFPIVFICGVKDGIIPLRRAGRDFDIDEERRLFYVGMTRARDELVLLTAPAPAPFIADIPGGHLEAGKAFTGRKQAPQFKQFSLFDL